MAESETTSRQGSNPVLTRKLASTDKRTRDKAVALLALWISCQQEVDEDNLKKVWKGLFYCVWHADKAPVQQELIENLAGLLDKADPEVSITFFKVFLSTMRREWGGIDQLRLDKFYLLLRRFLSHMFKVLETRGWDQGITVKFMEALEERAFLANDKFPALGVNLHFADVYWDEFRKFLPAPRGVLGLLLEPFISILSRSTDKVMLKRVRDNIFNPLAEDGRNLSQDIKEKDGSEKKARTLGYLLHSTPVVSRLFELASTASTPQANRKVLYELHDEFSKVAKALDSIDQAVYDRYFQAKETNIVGQLAQGDAEDVVEEGGRMSRSRLRRRQARAQALGVKDPVSFKSKKSSKSKTTLGKKNRDEELNGNGDHQAVEVEGGEGGDGGEPPAKKKRNSKSAVVTAGVNLPLLQKRLSKKKEKKKKKDVVSTVSEESSLGAASVTESAVVQPSSTPTGVAENGHRSINDVTMNLEKQFDFVAAEDEDRSPKSSGSQDSSCETRGKKKRKKDKIAAQAASQAASMVEDVPDVPQEAADVVTPSNNDDNSDVVVKKSKKVRFALRNNIVWKPQGPLPPLSVRTPPSATPRGSALKVGVPPGPIRTRPIRVTRGTGMKSRKRVTKQYISASSQKPTRTSARKVRRQSV
ncbi:ribosomal RNA-processing protein 1 [Marchantia polymorpha subsp. ruderalis]